MIYMYQNSLYAGTMNLNREDEKYVEIQKKGFFRKQKR